MNLQQGLIIEYNQRQKLEEYFPKEFMGVADRFLLNSMIRTQEVLGFESFGSIMRQMKGFGYKTPKAF